MQCSSPSQHLEQRWSFHNFPFQIRGQSSSRQCCGLSWENHHSLFFIDYGTQLNNISRTNNIVKTNGLWHRRCIVTVVGWGRTSYTPVCDTVIPRIQRCSKRYWVISSRCPNFRGLEEEEDIWDVIGGPHYVCASLRFMALWMHITFSRGTGSNKRSKTGNVIVLLTIIQALRE